MFNFSNRKTILYVVIYTLLIFGSGVLIGKCQFASHKGKHWTKKYEHQQKDKIKKLVDALSLTEQQETQLTAIIEKHKVSMKEMDKGMKEKFQHAREQKIAEINAILTPDQQLKFKELIEKYKKRGKKHHRSQEH